MSKSSSFLKGVMPLVYAIVSVPAFFVLYLWFLVDGFGLLGEPVCRTEVQGRLAGLSGFDFEISETSCFFDPAVSVFGIARLLHILPQRQMGNSYGQYGIGVVDYSSRDGPDEC